MPTPIEKILQLVTTKYKQGITQIECQDSILKPTREPFHELLNHRYHLKKMSNNGKQNSKIAKEERLSRCLARGDACTSRQQNLRQTLSISSAADKAKQSKAKQSKASKAKPSKAKQCKAKQRKASKAKQSKRCKAKQAKHSKA